MPLAAAAGTGGRRVSAAWGRGRASPPVLLAAAAAVAAGLVLLPLATTVLQACELSATEAAALLFRPLVATLLANTVGLVLATTACAGIAGTAIAWFIERTNVPGRAAWGVLAVAPLAVPPFVTSYAWVSISHDLQGFWGALLVVTCAYTPLVTLPCAAALRGLDPALEETARSLGLGSLSCFRRVVFPQLRPALLGGMLLVALNTLVEFGAFSLLRFRTFTTELYAEYRTGLDGPPSALLAVVLITLCVLCLVAEQRVRGHARYARVGRFTRRGAVPLRLGLWTWPVVAGFALLGVVTLGVPIGMVLFWLTQHAEAATSPAAPSAAALLGALATSAAYGAAGAAAAVTLALPLGHLATRYPGRWVMLLERAAYLGQGVPAIVVALALVSLALLVPALYQSAVLLIATYAILFLPLALVSVRAALGQVQRGLEEAGRSLGLGWFETTRRVLLPLAAPGIGAGAAIVFVSVATELTATLLLSPIGTRTLATEIWANTSSLAYAAAAPFAAAMLGISLLSTWVLARRFGAANLAS